MEPVAPYGSALAGTSCGRRPAPGGEHVSNPVRAMAPALRKRALVAALVLAVAGAGVVVWRGERARRVASDDAAAELVAAQLEALGYVAEVTDELDPSRSGVVLHDASRTSPGVNVYCSVHGDRVHFVDMEGRELHTIALADTGEGSDCMVEPYGERSFLALAWPTLTLLDFDSRVVWRSEEGQHHDVAVDAEGRVWTLLLQESVLRERGHTLPFVDDVLARLGPGGEVQWKLPLSELFAHAVPAERLVRMEEILARLGRGSPEYAAASDVLHFNTVEVLDRDLAVARRGTVLLCARELDLVAIVDPETRTVVWSWGGPGKLSRPHHPSVLPNGNVLIFDNGVRRGWSRLIEVEPATGEIVWRYRGDPPRTFSSTVRGSAQALPNGNVLVTESTRGRVFEVTRDGSIVWTFLNPEFEESSRRQIYRMQRVSLERYAAWVGSASGSSR
jgi:Arylsulfotransferase (ASST)